jgi:predicted house-cleaning noncanonical NTP pyrophosphatase (MazG superfamily)
MAQPHPDGYLVKLVRDRVASMLGGDGTLTYRPMPHDEHVKRLRAKLLEEVVEYATDPSLAELAHVYEAVCALASIAHETDIDAVADAALAEHEVRGGFMQGIGMYALHPWDCPGGAVQDG